MAIVLRYLNPVVRFQKKGTWGGIYSIQEFYALLHRECARSDRTGDKFSLVVFEISDISEDQATADRLAQILTKRVRSIDVVGWFDAERIGVILPETPSNGARKLAHDICQLVTAKPPLVFKVYTYPLEWLPPREDFSNQPHTEDQSDGSVASDAGPDGVTLCESEAQALGLAPILARGMPRWKRTIDLMGSVVALALWSPLFLLIAAVIKSVSPGPVFFKQERIGYLGRPFTLWKFRTMKVDADHSVHLEHLRNLIHSEEALTKLDETDDRRVVPLGRFLRQIGLDELPQLINVFRGEMSLVGPRPCMSYEAQEYLLWHRKRCNIFPGITGLWQVNGKNKTTHTEMMRWDIRYSEKMSFWLDLTIFFRTLPAIIEQATWSYFQKKERRLCVR